MRPELSREKVLETLGVLALACLVLGHFAKRPALKTGFLAAASLLLAVALFAGPVARQIARGWLAFGEVLAAVNSRIILGALYFLFLTPIALLSRLSRGDTLQLKRLPGAGRSYWHVRDHAYVRKDIEKLW
jgi:hypothetical protein